jgi:hypothetical protein
LECSATEVVATGDVALRLWVINKGKTPILFNGRLIPSENGNNLESLSTPIILWFERKDEGNDAEKPRVVRSIHRSSTVSELPADPEYRVPLFKTVDRKAGRVTPGLTVRPPLTAGRWRVWCEVIMPNPNPDRRESFGIKSNSIEIKVKER